MKKRLIIGLIQFVIIIICNNVWGQTGWNFDYTYDASGNRIKRTASEIILKLANDSTNTDSVAQAQKPNQISNSNIIDEYLINENSSNANDSKGIKNNSIKNSENLLNEDVLVYPNPTFGLLNVDIKNYTNLTGTKIILYTEQGALLLQNEVKDSNSKLDLRGYSAGVYYLKLLMNGNSKTYKIIKEN